MRLTSEANLSINKRILKCQPFLHRVYFATVQGPVVRKPINANPGLKVNRGFHLAR